MTQNKLIPKVSESDLAEAAHRLNLDRPKKSKKSFRTYEIHGVSQEKLKEEMQSVLFHKLRAKAWLKKQEYQDVLEMRETIEDFLNDVREAEEEKIRLRKEKEQAISSIQQKMKELGITPDDLAGYTPPPPKRTIVTKFKIHMFGQDHVWSGRGHPPVPFKCFMAKGHDIMQYLIPEEEREVITEKIIYDIPEQFSKQVDSLLSQYRKMKKQGKI